MGHTEDSKLIALLQDHELDTVARKFGMHRNEVREFLKKMKAEGKHARSRDDVEKELRADGIFPVDEQIPPDTEAPELPTNDTYVTS